MSLLIDFVTKLKIIIIIIAFALYCTEIVYSQTKGESKQKKKKEIPVKLEKKTELKDKVSKPSSLEKSTKDNTSTEEFKFTEVEQVVDTESMSGTIEWNVIVKDDNDNAHLPTRFRTWWYVRLDGANKGVPVKVNIVGDGWPGRDYVLPVYSYDRISWHRFKPEEVIPDKSADGLYNYSLIKSFDSTTVWLARYYPYPFSRLNNLLKKYSKNQYLKVEKIGETPLKNPLLMLTITDPKADDTRKKRIWIHCRTHPSETGSSFVLEGLLEYLLSDCNINCRKADLTKLIFNIVPIVNVDGVIAGNSRVTPGKSIDLEREWIRRNDNQYLLQDTIANEVKIIHSVISKLIKTGPEFIGAFNLHSKNAPPSWRSFLYTNFTKTLEGNGSVGDSLFYKHLLFTKILSDEFCGDTVNIRPSYDPGIPMDKKVFPESWWWANFKDSVLALTLETTSGYDGCYEEWVNWQDHKKLGEALAIAIQRYYNYFIEKKWHRYEAPERDISKLMKFYIDETVPR